MEPDTISSLNGVDDEIDNENSSNGSSSRSGDGHIPKKTLESINGNDLKYIVDPSLPGVAKHLRLLGIDCAYEDSYTDAYLLHLARLEDRIVITRSKKLVNRIQIDSQRSTNRRKKWQKFNAQLNEYKSSHSEEEWDEDTLEHLEDQLDMVQSEINEEYEYDYYWVNVIGRKKQLSEIVNALKIVFIQDRMFTRCSKCNGVNTPVEDKNAVRGKVHENVFEENDVFAMCNQCGWVTWGTIEQNAKFPSQVNIYQNAVHFCQKYSYHPTTTTTDDVSSITSLLKE